MTLTALLSFVGIKTEITHSFTFLIYHTESIFLNKAVLFFLIKGNVALDLLFHFRVLSNPPLEGEPRTDLVEGLNAPSGQVVSPNLDGRMDG